MAWKHARFSSLFLVKRREFLLFLSPKREETPLLGMLAAWHPIDIFPRNIDMFLVAVRMWIETVVLWSVQENQNRDARRGDVRGDGAADGGGGGPVRRVEGSGGAVRAEQRAGAAGGAEQARCTGFGSTHPPLLRPKRSRRSGSCTRNARDFFLLRKTVRTRHAPPARRTRGLQAHIPDEAESTRGRTATGPPVLHWGLACALHHPSWTNFQ